MLYLLDTNICIYAINQSHPKLDRRMAQCKEEDIVLSSIVVSELMFGVENSQKRSENKNDVEAFIANFTALPYGTGEAPVYGSIRAHLRRMGETIGAVDTFIATHALANDLILVTNNTREFSRVLNLKLEDWSR